MRAFKYSEMPKFCNNIGCNKPLDVPGESSWHALDCQKLRGGLRTDRHDSVCRIVHHAFTKAGVRTECEPTNMSGEGNNKRVDMIAYTQPAPIAIDVEVMNTSAESYQSRFSTPTIALDYAADVKTKKHSGTAASIRGPVKPFIVSTHGQYQADALSVIGMIAGHAHTNGVAHSADEVVNGMKATIAITIQKHNAIIMLASLHRPVSTTFAGGFATRRKNTNSTFHSQQQQQQRGHSSNSNSGGGDSSSRATAKQRTERRMKAAAKAAATAAASSNNSTQRTVALALSVDIDSQSIIINSDDGDDSSSNNNDNNDQPQQQLISSSSARNGTAAGSSISNNVRVQLDDSDSNKRQRTCTYNKRAVVTTQQYQAELIRIASEQQQQAESEQQQEADSEQQQEASDEPEQQQERENEEVEEYECKYPSADEDEVVEESSRDGDDEREQLDDEVVERESEKADELVASSATLIAPAAAAATETAAAATATATSEQSESSRPASPTDRWQPPPFRLSQVDVSEEVKQLLEAVPFVAPEQSESED